MPGTIRVGDQLGLGDQRVRVRGLECLQQPVDTVSGTARVALSLAGRVTQDGHRADVLVTPGAFEDVGVVDVRLRHASDVPERPLLHVGATSLSVHARPLDEQHLRLTLDRSLPLRVGDRLIVRDPGSRRIWGAVVLDADPAALRRRGAAAARAKALAGLDGTVAAQLAMRGVAERSRLRRLGIHHASLPAGTVQAGDWVVDPPRARELAEELEALVQQASRDGGAGIAPVQAAQQLGLPTPELVPKLADPGTRLESGRLRLGPGRRPQPPPSPAVSAITADLATAPFAAPDAHRLAELGLDDPALQRLHRDGSLLRLADRVVLLPGADQEAAARLAGLEQPFTTSAARQALDTTRRVALPLLAHLDKAGFTVRLADDRRRMRG